MSGTPKKLATALVYYKGTVTRVITTYVEQVQVEADGWQLSGPVPASDRFVLLSEFQAALAGGAFGATPALVFSSPDGHLYVDLSTAGGPRVTMSAGHAYLDPAGTAPAAAVSIVNGHLVVETGV